MSYTEHYCRSCPHWQWTKGEDGYCAIYSSSCATAISNHKPPPRYLSMADVFDEAKVEEVYQQLRKAK